MNLDPLEIGGPDECWMWHGGRTQSGYGRAWCSEDKKMKRIHRVIYETVRGELPEGLTIDHLCENKLCQNPAHLEAVPIGVNLVRSENTQVGKNVRKQHCYRCGGEYTERKVRARGGWRTARVCVPCVRSDNRIRMREYCARPEVKERRRERTRRMKELSAVG